MHFKCHLNVFAGSRGEILSKNRHATIVNAVLLISYLPIRAKRLVPYKSLYLVIFDICKADFSTNRRRIVFGT